MGGNLKAKNIVQYLNTEHSSEVLNAMADPSIHMVVVIDAGAYPEGKNSSKDDMLLRNRSKLMAKSSNCTHLSSSWRSQSPAC